MYELHVQYGDSNARPLLNRPVIFSCQLQSRYILKPVSNTVT